MNDNERTAFIKTLSALVAAVSILEHAEREGVRPSKVCWSDCMFKQCMADYHKAIVDGRKCL